MKKKIQASVKLLRKAKTDLGREIGKKEEGRPYSLSLPADTTTQSRVENSIFTEGMFSNPDLGERSIREVKIPEIKGGSIGFNVLTDEDAQRLLELMKTNPHMAQINIGNVATNFLFDARLLEKVSWIEFGNISSSFGLIFPSSLEKLNFGDIEACVILNLDTSDNESQSKMELPSTLREIKFGVVSGNIIFPPAIKERRVVVTFKQIEVSASIVLPVGEGSLVEVKCEKMPRLFHFS